MTTEDYIASHISPEPPELKKLYRYTHMHRLYPRMCTDHIQGRMLVMLTRMIRPLRVLEMGTFTGYSTLCFAEGLPDGAHIDTVEADPEKSDYDMAFIDADKRRYPEYYRMLRGHMRSGAYILADNTLWDDKILNPDARDSQTEGIRRFNDIVAADAGVEKVMIPMRDGLTLIRIL